MCSPAPPHLVQTARQSRGPYRLVRRRYTENQGNRTEGRGELNPPIKHNGSTLRSNTGHRAREFITGSFQADACLRRLSLSPFSIGFSLRVRRRTNLLLAFRREARISRNLLIEQGLTAYRTPYTCICTAQLTCNNTA